MCFSDRYQELLLSVKCGRVTMGWNLVVGDVVFVFFVYPGRILPPEYEESSLPEEERGATRIHELSCPNRNHERKYRKQNAW